MRSNHKLNHIRGVLRRVEELWNPKYTHPQKIFFENFWRGRLNKYDELGKLFLLRAIEECKTKKYVRQIFEIPSLG